MQNNIENKIHSLDTYTIISNAKFDVCFIVISFNFYETNRLAKTPTPKIKPNQEGKQNHKVLESLNNNTCIRLEEGKKKNERTAITMVAF